MFLKTGPFLIQRQFPLEQGIHTMAARYFVSGIDRYSPNLLILGID
jgi:hypothetical protein